ncbi:TonB-dependent receptor-like protein [Jejuia pallidilutea]|uniref:TonB-dependent receptor-like protein n=1 Tax=Jejuia pallidilutea TaxID=504487 RepID=A0A362XBG3_9FLAO|nr:TonB-dependent receptor plug domain-containing protein [Jejuia pallidilutea]PQV51561.1 TonB-dependent receptor-like protein [Jejuia pallidilutea]
MKTKQLIVLSVLFIFSTLSLCAQNKNKDAASKTITGLVKDFNNTPLSGVYIYVDSVKTKTRTNRKGEYKLKIHPNTKLITAYSPNHGILSLSYSGEKKVSFAFSDEAKPLDTKELYEMGFGKPLRKSSGKVDFEGVRGLNGFNNIYQLIEGVFAGVSVTGTSINIRGATTSTTNAGNSTEPLLLVDNVPFLDISNIIPSEVKSIEVIKGPNAAYYGARGVYGVVKITLKN